MTIAQDARAAFALDCDVLVVGGGAAGLAAAVTAARKGAKVVLLERYGFCGGAAVAGLSGTVCGLYTATDNAKAPPEQVVRGGFVDDFLRTIDAQGRPDRADPLRQDVHARARPAGLARDGRCAAPGRRRQGAVPQHRDRRAERRRAHRRRRRVDQAGPRPGESAKITIDASGDGDVAALAGLPTFMGDNGQVQNPTMIFRLQGVDVPRFLGAFGEDSHPRRAGGADDQEPAQFAATMRCRAPRCSCSRRRGPASCCATQRASSAATGAS